MASPFSVFRKNKKVMMALVTLLAIIAFVFLGNMNSGGSGRNAAERVAVTTKKFGNLRESDVMALIQRRVQLLRVLTAMNPRQRWENLFGQTNEQAVVDSWLMARHASQMGMVVSDATVNQWLKEITQDAVSRADILAALKGAGFSQHQFFAALRDEILAIDLRYMFKQSLGGFTPAQRWEFFTRVNERGSIEAVPVPVARYVDRVTDPDDETLKAFFEKYKEALPPPESPEPGFRQPHRVALEYVKAEMDKFDTPEAITDADIQAYYEKNRERYEPTEEPKPETKPQDEAKPEAAAKDAPAEKPADAAGEKKAVDPKETAPKKDAAKTPDAKTDAKETDAKKDSKGTTRAKAKARFLLTAMQQDAKPAETATTPPAAAPAAKPETPKVETPKPESPKTEPSKAEAPAKAASPTGAAAPSKDAAPAEVEKAAPPSKNVISESLKSRIRRDIAAERISKAFDSLRREMDQYKSEWNVYGAERIRASATENGKGQQKPASPPPVRPDLEKLAKPLGLSVGHTKLKTQWEMRSEPIGNTIVGGREFLWHSAFQSPMMFHAERSISLDGSFYQFWMIEEAKERVPKWEDEGVRDRVLQAWKMIKARDIALEAAQSLARDARKAGKSLKQAFADRQDVQVLNPAPFSWMTYGSIATGSAPDAVRLSPVEGIDMAGPDFMRTVFGLSNDEVGVASNAPKTSVYVVRMDGRSPAHETLWRQFEREDFRKYAAVANEDVQEMYNAWLKEIKDSAGFKWAEGRKSPDAGSQQQEEE